MTLDQAAPQVTPTPAPQGQGPIQRILVEGTQRIEPDSVLSYLLLRQGQAYDPAIADRSLKVLFDTGLFSDVRMDWDGMTLTVRVVENPILNQVVYEGNSQLSDTDLNKEVQVRPRMVFTRARVQADVQRIIVQGITEANRVRAQIRLPIGVRTKMVFAVTDSTGGHGGAAQAMLGQEATQPFELVTRPEPHHLPSLDR